MNESVQKAAISTEAVKTVEKKVINGMEFVSLGMEEYRRYTFPKGTITITDPQWLFVRPSGAHTVLGKDGEAHYIPNTFISLSWRQREGFEEAEF